MKDRAERWHRVSELFDRVADLDPAQRRQVLAAECGDDTELRAEVERLLHADSLTSPLDQDIAAQASLLLLEGDPEQYHGQLFGPYRIVRLLGQGGMGRVYLAQRDGEDFAQTVALKLVGGFGSFEAGLARRRFLDERRILARLEHPHIARLLDGGVGPEAQPWFAMEYVDGAPLTRWCDEHTLSIPARLTLFAKVCDAVDHAHQFLIVHRDLKPGNVLVDARGEPKVLDFGIAKLLDEGAPSGVGSTILMTPDYAAPEQVRGGQISTATDVYSLGAMLFELLTGGRPFSDPLASREPPLASRRMTGEGCVAHAVTCNTTVPRLRKALRGDLDRILRTALDPSPARRYRSAAKLAEDLRAVVAGQPISLRSDRAYRLGVFLRRHRLGAAAASAAALALLGTTGWALWQTRQAAERAREATRQEQIATQESRTAVSVKNLIAGLLSSAAPEVSLGKQLTVKEVLDNSSQTLSAALAQEPEVAVELLTVMARSYMSLEEYASARPLLERALAFAPQADAQRLMALHTARLEMGWRLNDETVRQSSTKALYGLLPQVDDAGLRVEALMVLGHGLVSGPRDSELASIEELLEAARKALPKSDVRRIQAATQLAGWRISRTLGRGEQSATVAMLNETLADAERYLPARHPHTTQVRAQLATLYNLQNQPEPRARLLQGILDEHVAVFGKNSLNVARTLSDISQNEMALGRYGQAAVYARRALAIFEPNPMAEILQRAPTKQYLAKAEAVAGNYAQAQDWYQAAVDDYRLDPKHGGMQIPFVQLKIVRMMALQGQRDAAIRLQQQVLASVKPGSAAQAMAWLEQGRLAREGGDAADALDLHQRAAAQLKQRRMAPYAKANRLSAMLELALDQQALDQAAASEATLAELVRELDTEAFPFTHPELIDAYLLLGHALSARSGQQAEARRLLARCMELRGIVYGPNDPRTAEVRTTLAAVGGH